MLRGLRARISTLYTVLFLAVFGPAFALVFVVIQDEVKTTIREELTASGGVFDRLLAARADQLGESAEVLSRDFGFREAFATRDRSTIESALVNLTGRLGVDRALVLDADGLVIAGSADAAVGESFPYESLLRASEDDGAASTIAAFDGAPYQVVAAPVFAPTLVGWTVFAESLDGGLAQELRGLAPIALETRFETAGMAAAVRSIPNSDSLALIDDSAALAGFSGERGPELVLFKALDAAEESAPVTLVLNYPIRETLARYGHLATAIVVLAGLGVAALIWGSWLVSSGVTRPIRALADAASRLRAGEYVKVEARGGGQEVADLAQGFNAMVEGIDSRERRITHLAMHDSETGLANRAALLRRLHDMIEAQGALGGPVHLAAFGIDRFVDIRAAIGHTQSGMLLREVARKLEALRPGDTVARLTSSALGLAFRAQDARAADAVTAAVREAFERQPIVLGANSVDVRLSAGLAACPEDAADAQTLFERAQIALDQARAAGLGAGRFDPERERATAGNLNLLSDLRRGLELGQIALAHQPKLDLRRGEITGVECLIRWTHPERGLVPPDAFIPLAEETGLIGAMTEWVLARALDDQRRYAAAGCDLRVAVNISARSLAEPRFADTVATLLADKGVAPDRLTLEITETAVMERPDAALATLGRLKDMGLTLSIDDYGAGFSSLAYLKRLPVHELKIDKSFVVNLSKDKNDAVLVRSTVDLAHSLGLRVVAEGVEDQACLELLALFGCDYAQGFHVGRPSAQAAVLKMLKPSPAQSAAEPPRRLAL
jgi:diguanylate cyclase (GGDEF)-like protein